MGYQVTAQCGSAPVRTMDDENCNLERMGALYRDTGDAAGVEPLPDHEAGELARRFHDLSAPAFEVEFKRH